MAALGFQCTGLIDRKWSITKQWHYESNAAFEDSKASHFGA